MDGRPIAEAPSRPLSVLATDREFDNGSRITTSSLSQVQVQNLKMLARVWGFLKYHHPAIISGRHHWDYELFRVMPRVLGAADGEEAARTMLEWIAKLGDVPECRSCAKLDGLDAHLKPMLEWLSDETLPVAELRDVLQSIYRKRETRAGQFYITLTPGVRNPVYENELSYPGVRFPDPGYQLLGLFRYWNMIEYFFPYRDVLSEEPGYWNAVLEEFIPRVAAANASVAFQQEMLQFIAKINDTHANLWSSLGARPPLGSCQLPVDVRFVEGKPLVVRWNARQDGEQTLKAGDVILRLDGVAYEELVQQWRPYYAASNEPTRRRDIGVSFTRGACGAATVTVDRAGEVMDLTATRVSMNTLDLSRVTRHDRQGEAFQKLSDDVAYLKLGDVQAASTRSYIENAAGTKGIVLDLRNYPSEFVVFALGQYLVPQATDFARFTRADLSNPGAFVWDAVATIAPASPRYQGKIAILIDEVTQSSAEYHAMAFRSVPGAVVIGSTTAGADGNVSTVPLPGGLRSLYSGIGVFYPDKRPTQRIGIVPDIEVKPTIEGIRAGRDELLEEAIRQITGAQ